MSLRLYLDEDLPPRLARNLRDLGFDVVSAHDRRAFGDSDEAALERASAEGRAILTCNFVDFIRLARERANTSRPHAGIIVSYRQWTRRELGTVTNLVSRFVESHSAEDLANSLYVLPGSATSAPE